MTQRKMTEPEILDGFENALRENQIFACYQPQYNHSAGRMTGAEALMRWNHLTVGRVPFHVRYTTEFDENGGPLKAYGSATLVVDDAPSAASA